MGSWPREFNAFGTPCEARRAVTIEYVSLFPEIGDAIGFPCVLMGVQACSALKSVAARDARLGYDHR